MFHAFRSQNYGMVVKVNYMNMSLNNNIFKQPNCYFNTFKRARVTIFQLGCFIIS